MTLVVSLRVPDGVVLAADSLQTTQATIIPGLKDFKTACPKCSEEITLEKIQMPPIQMPMSTSSYAQKLFPFTKKFGAASFGSGIVNNRTIYYQMKILEKSLSEESIVSVSEAADKILEYFDEELKKELKNRNLDIASAPEDFYPFGFQIVGYETDQDVSGKTIEVLIGKKSIKRDIEGIGCTVSGDRQVVAKLWELREEDPRFSTNFGSFSLQDAIDYAEFLIRTTAMHQRFSNMIPTVGGAVDIALVTTHSGFSWIKFKKLTKILEEI
ncbi:MAG: hypothetical protein D6813_08050 [Calditrichaeota bacterium]|nr:MAG: hypothetical protein D6813_08050 [Calditrichota bacterium]